MLIIAQYELTPENSHNNAVISGIKGQLHEIPSFSIKAAAEFLPQSPEEQTKWLIILLLVENQAMLQQYAPNKTYHHNNEVCNILDTNIWN